MVKISSSPGPASAVEPSPKTETFGYRVIGGKTSGSDRGPFRRFWPSALLFLALLLAVAADHLLGSWLGFSQPPSGYLGIYRRVGPKTGPQILCAGSSLLYRVCPGPTSRKPSARESKPGAWAGHRLTFGRVATAETAIKRNHHWCFGVRPQRNAPGRRACASCAALANNQRSLGIPRGPRFSAPNSHAVCAEVCAIPVSDRRRMPTRYWLEYEAKSQNYWDARPAWQSMRALWLSQILRFWRLESPLRGSVTGPERDCSGSQSFAPRIAVATSSSMVPRTPSLSQDAVASPTAGARDRRCLAGERGHTPKSSSIRVTYAAFERGDPPRPWQSRRRRRS